MLWLWILAALAALFLLFCLIRLGIQIVVEDTASAYVTAGFFKFQVVPSRKRKKPKREKPKKAPKDRSAALKRIPRPTLTDLKLAYDTLWPPTKRALERTRRGVRFSPLTLRITIPGKADPALAAEGCGWANGAVWTGMPVLEQLLDIPDPAIHIGVDFDREQWLVRGRLGVSIRIGTLLALGFGTMIPTIKWLMQYRRAHKPPVEKPKPQTPPTDQAA